MLREQRNEIFYEFFGSKTRKEKREKERIKKYEENLKIYNLTKPKLKKYIIELKKLIASNVKEYNENFKDEKITCKFKCTNHEDKTYGYCYEEMITLFLFDKNNKELDWNGYDEIVTPAKDTIYDMIEKGMPVICYY